jgi:diphosphomevalonate decarboxylase
MSEAPKSSFESCWWAPSNIALVKYWGKKKGYQLPANPSVSLTLSKAKTRVQLKASPKASTVNDRPWIDLTFAGRKMPGFVPKIEKFFTHATHEMPFLNEYVFDLDSENTFPHSAGIASSASSMAAMALCLVDLEQEVTGNVLEKNQYYQRASYFARMGSGSACRSLYAPAASWGESQGGAQGSSQGSDLYAEVVECHPIYQNMHDSIIIVSAAEKKVSSRAGHGLMEEHFYGKARYDHAQYNWNYAIEWLKDGSWDHLGNLVEEEALTLHAMMMSSRPGYLLMEPKTIEVINRLRDFRYETGVAVYFTLDAGPNLHLLYPHSERAQVKAFIDHILKELGEEVSLLDDVVGRGPEKGSLS